MKTRMFEVDGKRVKTLNCLTGCKYNCSYCFARKLVETKLKDAPKYKDCGFDPAIHPKELIKSLGKNKIYFVVDMGDMWGEWNDDDLIQLVLNKCKNADKSNTFMFLTKNPQRYVVYFDENPEDYQDNFILGATIETTKDELGLKYSEAPNESHRYYYMKRLKDFRKFISIEPIMDFDDVRYLNADTLGDWIETINPEFVYIGYDNYDNHLHEPSLEKTTKLIEELKKFTEVRLKTIRERWDA